jgi:hypothetical protein
VQWEHRRFAGNNTDKGENVGCYFYGTKGTFHMGWQKGWTFYPVNASDPIIVGDQMFIATGYGKGGALFTLGPGEPMEVWKTKKLRTQLNAAVLYEGNLYGVDGDTTAACEEGENKCGQGPEDDFSRGRNSVGVHWLLK